MPVAPEFIPFNKPSIVGDEIGLMAQAATAGQLADYGTFCERVETFLSEKHSARVMLTKSCTHALEMAMMLLEIGRGDEVIVPSFAFASCANAVALRGAKPVFVDVMRETCNIDPDAVANALTARTRAILAIHYGGVPSDVRALAELARRQGIALVEDAAHCTFGKMDDHALGTFGRFGTLSFHETKNIHCGEGGALILNHAADAPTAELLRDKGTDRARYLRGEVSEYTWQHLGSSFGLPNVLSAFLFGQLQQLEEVQSQRRRLWIRYDEGLRASVERRGYGSMRPPRNTEPSYHTYYLILNDRSERDDLIDYLAERNIYAVFHYQPLHRSDFARKIGADDARCPASDLIADRIIRLPLFHDMTESQQMRVIDAVEDFAQK
ncbi:MAG: dTDP-4-amino-4,6-dideoxygalactose transaminase [Candidatus Eremiobacteraeota bacterium]|nr:dTDP-4-amino-4,6-dideoxygalactose transaminase [Candidatus Eremiobacteraeota bacterium]